MPKQSKITAPTHDDGLGFITDRQAEALGLDPERAADQLADADALYRHVAQKPGEDRAALVEWANGKWGDGAVDRLNAALAFLTAAGRLVGAE